MTEDSNDVVEVETAEAIESDVNLALLRWTDDGDGETRPGESDFVSFATDDVEEED